MDLPLLGAIVFSALTAGVVVFQVALALGPPLGAYAMGGSFPGRMPPAMRVAALVQGAVLAGLAVIVLSAGEVLVTGLVADLGWLAWIPVAISGIAVVLNAATPSGGERRIWLPVALVLLAASLAVVLG